MKRLLTTSVLVAIAFTLTATPQANTQTREHKLQQAIDLIESKGDLTTAMPLLEDVAKSPDRGLAARALLYLAQAQERQGQAQARKTYERIVNDFATQTDIAGQARARLAALTTGTPAVAAGITNRLVWRTDKLAVNLRTVSPDGRQLVYGNELGDLYIHDVANNTDRRLTNVGTFSGPNEESWQYEDGGSAFSRDGAQLAYSWTKGKSGELRVITARGSGIPQPRVLLADPRVGGITPHDWSTDGQWIAASIWRKDLKDSPEQIVVVSTRDGSMRVLKTLDAVVAAADTAARRVWRPLRMSFSTDGKYLATDDRTVRPNGITRNNIVVLDLENDREVMAVTSRHDNFLIGWTPDGTRVVFASDRSATLALWTLAFNNGAVRAAPELIKETTGLLAMGVASSNAVALGLTPSGAFYYAGVGVRDAKIQIASFDFDALRFLTPAVGLVDDYVGTNTGPRWSPDGKSLAYVSDLRRTPNSAPDVVLRVRSLETHDVRELRPQFPWRNGLRWSLDGRSLFMFGTSGAGTGDERIQLMKVDVQSAATTTLASLQARPGEGIGLAGPWAQDGQKLYYFRDFQRHTTLVEHDMTSGLGRDVLHHADLKFPYMTPDHRAFVGFVNDAAKRSRSLVLVPLQGDPARTLLEVTGPDILPAYLTFTQDGAAAFVRISRSAASQFLWRVPLDGSPARKLDRDVPRLEQFEVGPDGRQVAWLPSGSAAPADVFVIEHFLPKASSIKR